jgi:acetoin:2,6-dichlorophenolindophenol oxidoreductase subunit alpha
MTTLETGAATSIYRRMSLIRAGEDRIIRGLSSGEFGFTYYPVRGHEAIAATLGEILRPDDQLSATYRCFHDIVAKGTSLREIISEQMGKAAGTSKGKGGPMHISDPRSGLMVTTGVVGSGIPIATGLALAAKLDGSDRIAVATFGDGASSIGATHEAMNLAALWDLPLVFLCQNNMWGEHTPLAEYTKTARLAERAAGYGMPGVTVDGRKPQDLYPVVSEAVERARAGGGPTFVEAVTYRILAHSFGNDQSYQPKEDLQRAIENEPVKTYRAWLLAEGMADAGALDTIDREASESVEDAIEFAKSSPQPGMDELLCDVFASPSEVPV